MIIDWLSMPNAARMWADCVMVLISNCQSSFQLLTFMNVIFEDKSS